MTIPGPSLLRVNQFLDTFTTKHVKYNNLLLATDVHVFELLLVDMCSDYFVA